MLDTVDPHPSNFLCSSILSMRTLIVMAWIYYFYFYEVFGCVINLCLIVDRIKIIEIVLVPIITFTI